MKHPKWRLLPPARTIAAGLVAGLTLLDPTSTSVPAAEAQQPPATPAGLETIQIRPNVYVIFGAGSNITVHLGEDGVVLVDAGTEALAPQVVNAVHAITSLPIRLIVNTSADADHVTGNEIVSAAGREINPDAFSDQPHATVLAHENVMLRMSNPSGNDTAMPSELWPSETYTARVRSMYVNDEALLVYRFTGAHSDADSVVMFRKADVIATGDILDLRHFPVIDTAKGGSIQGELAALNRLLEMTVPAMPLVLKPGRTLLVPGHGRVSDYAELVEYRDMVTTIKDNIEALIKEGRTLAQIQAANPTAGYRARWGRETGPWTTAQFVEAIYHGLTNPVEGQ
ncbi:MAG: MBL fold metallo-hydrolase [Acidobacteria bacterium]|nr:MBL fold metallo-hydrolase [Acidobacteriota bacterium]